MRPSITGGIDVGTRTEHDHPTVISLFSGVGGGILGGMLLGWEPVCAVEIDPFCQNVLRWRMRDGWIPDIPIWSDVRTFDGKPWSADIVTAGFPCQPYSVNGRQQADQDERDQWEPTAKRIREIQPAIAVLENVPAITSGLGRILAGLDEIRFDAVWTCIPAGAVDAPHRRDRWWCLAVNRQMADTAKVYLQGCGPAGVEISSAPAGSKLSGCDRSGTRTGYWEAESPVSRMDDGVANWVDRTKAIGNGIVPQQMAFAVCRLTEIASEQLF